VGLTSVLLLSDRSSGSSILQRELASHPDVHVVASTWHNEQETLFWNRAAALLGRPQEVLHYSTEIPFSVERARTELQRFLADNLPRWRQPDSDDTLVFEGWHELCMAFGPVFLEKSPHHLHSRSALELIVEADGRLPDVDFRYVGLVRNPMDVLYSQWRRWRAFPEVAQHDWQRAYENLERLQRVAGDRVMVVRYEELVTNPQVIRDVCGFIGIDWTPEIGAQLRSSSVKRWRTEPRFGFVLDPGVRAFANHLGYPDEELHNEGDRRWPVERRYLRARWRFGKLRESLRP
jgi:hypothetical protein